MASTEVHLVLLDLKLGGEDGLALLKTLKVDEPAVPVIIITGHGDVASAVRCMQQGATNYIFKPIDNALLLSILDQERAANNGLLPPTTFDQMTKVVEALANRGITPLALGDNGIWASVHLPESVLLATMGPARYKGLWTGATPWDGGELRTALSRFGMLLRYVNTDHATLSWDAAAQYVIDGKCAMTVMGDWAEGYFKARGFTPGKEFDWVPFPGTRGSFMMLSDSFGLPRGAPDRDAAVKWLTVAASREGQDAFNPRKGSIPSRIDCDRSLYDVYLQSAMDSFKTDTIVPSVTHGAAAAEGWVYRIQDVIGTFVCDLDVEKAATGLVAAARKYGR